MKNLSLLSSALLLLWVCSSCNNKNNDYNLKLSKKDSIAIFKTILHKTYSDIATQADAKSMIEGYKSLPFSIVVDNSNNNARGFYIDNKLINFIRDKQYSSVNGLYLYLAKKPFVAGDPKKDGQITVVAYMASPSIVNSAQDSLYINEALEWHDHISNRSVINEQLIGY